MLDLFDLFFPSLFWDEEPEELKKRFDRMLERYKEVREEQRRALASPQPSSVPVLSFEGTEQQFREGVQKLAELHKDKEVKAHSVEFPNGYYRSVVIRSKK